MHSGEYWAQRFAALEKTQIKSDAELAKEIDKLYRQAHREIESKISRWYMKFAQNNEISMADAKKLLKQGDLEEFKWSVDEYIQHGENNLDDTFTKQLINASSKVHISRYESILTELQVTAVSLMGKQETRLTEHLKDAYSKAYRHTAYEIQKGTGVGFRLGGIDEKSLETVLKKPWATDGSNFSDRIWKDKQSLLSELDTQLKRNILLGKGPDEAAEAIAKRFETSKANAYRLIQTESAAISSKAHEDCFHDLDVEEFEIVETLDGHTCPICGAMDGKHFPMSDYAVGVTVPPFHPNCRGTTVPYYADLEGYGERAARNANGETYFVPADTTYEQWEQMQDEQYGAGSVDKTREMLYNKSADLEQYRKYKDILEKNAPKSFEIFQKIKYDKKLYPMFKAYVNSIKTGELTPLADFALYQNISNAIDEKLVGITTANGIRITGKSNHFIARTIGSIEQRRNGVEISDSLRATIEPDKVFPVVTSKNGENSQRFITANVAITVNPDTGLLIQVNPL